MRQRVVRVDDFEVSGTGIAPQWEHTEWMPLTRVGKGPLAYGTRAKVLYSRLGVYLLADCEDHTLTCTGLDDNDNLYKEDVVELFLWPDTSYPLYFEYEISPLGAELPILVPNDGHSFHGWLPWNYQGGRMTRRATSVRGGPKKPGASVEGWSAEFFIPFSLLTGLRNTPPRQGTVWRANIYRIDYDAGEPTHWAWSPASGNVFHTYDGFGTLVFE